MATQMLNRGVKYRSAVARQRSNMVGRFVVRGLSLTRPRWKSLLVQFALVAFWVGFVVTLTHLF
jgi:hypothetical protein